MKRNALALTIAMGAGFLFPALAQEAAPKQEGPETEPNEQRVRRILASNDYPRFDKADYPLAIKEALAGSFRATWGLAISGYSPEAAQALLRIAGDKGLPDGNRRYALMGLRNFRASLSDSQNKQVRQILEGIVAERKTRAGEAEIGWLLDLGGVACIQETLGKDLVGWPHEPLVLQYAPGEAAIERLAEIGEEWAKAPNEQTFRRSYRAGWALVVRRDKRGVDVLLGMLPVGKGLDPQVRNNIYSFLAREVGQRFGYADGNYRPELEEAARTMRNWWAEHRETFRFPQAGRPEQR